MKRHREMRRAAGVFPVWRGGFTLIELMVVIGIMGMVLALGVPPFIRSIFERFGSSFSDFLEWGGRR